MPDTAPDDVLDVPEVDEEALDDWGLSAIAEDDGPEDGSPEPATPDPAASAAPVGEEAGLPGDADEAGTDAPDDAGPSATADRPSEETADPAPAEARPWTFKADGKEVTVPRSQVFQAEDGQEYIVLPAAEAKNLHPYLADRTAWREKEKTYLQQLAERDPEHNEQVVQAKELTAFLFDLFGKSDDEKLAAIDQLVTGRPTWEAEQKAKALEARLAARDGVQLEPDAELQRIQAEEEEQAARAEIDTEVGSMLARPEYAGLDKADMAALLWDLRHQIYFEAAEDLPQFGLKKGDIGINRGFIQNTLSREADRLKKLAARAAAGLKVEAANAGALRKNAPPRHPATSRQPAAVSAGSADEFDVEKWLKEDIDDL